MGVSGKRGQNLREVKQGPEGVGKPCGAKITKNNNQGRESLAKLVPTDGRAYVGKEEIRKTENLSHSGWGREGSKGRQCVQRLNGWGKRTGFGKNLEQAPGGQCARQSYREGVGLMIESKNI